MQFVTRTVESGEYPLLFYIAKLKTQLGVGELALTPICSFYHKKSRHDCRLDDQKSGSPANNESDRYVNVLSRLYED